MPRRPLNLTYIVPDTKRENIWECVCNVAVPLRSLVAFLPLVSSFIHLATHNGKSGRDRRELVSSLILSSCMLVDIHSICSRSGEGGNSGLEGKADSIRQNSTKRKRFVELHPASFSRLSIRSSGQRNAGTLPQSGVPPTLYH